MRTPTNKFSIGSAPLWLSGLKIQNKSRKYKVIELKVSVTADNYSCKYILGKVGIVGSYPLIHKKESELFQTKEELLNSIE